LSQNYPNPFNPSTTITFDIPGTFSIKEKVNLAVYDIRGRLVRILINSELDPGSYKVQWDGRNKHGQSVASGIYLCTLKAGSERFTRKMTVLK
jgi:flagellar hook assembly protein FlgD